MINDSINLTILMDKCENYPIIVLQSIIIKINKSKSVLLTFNDCTRKVSQKQI